MTELKNYTLKKKKKAELEGTEQNVNIVNVLIERGEKEKKIKNERQMKIGKRNQEKEANIKDKQRKSNM